MDARGVFGKLRLDYFVLGGAGLRGLAGYLAGSGFRVGWRTAGNV